MPSLTPLLWRHLPRYYDVTNSATMMSITLLLLRCNPPPTMRSLPFYYDVTSPILWCHFPYTMTPLPLYYDATSLILWRHFPYTMTPLPLYYDATSLILCRDYPYTMTSLPLYYDATSPILCRDYLLHYTIMNHSTRTYYYITTMTLFSIITANNTSMCTILSTTKRALLLRGLYY